MNYCLIQPTIWSILFEYISIFEQDGIEIINYWIFCWKINDEQMFFFALNTLFLIKPYKRTTVA